METHSVFLPGEIPWTEEPGGLQSMGLQRVGYDWVTNTHIHTFRHTHTPTPADTHPPSPGLELGPFSAMLHTHTHTQRNLNTTLKIVIKSQEKRINVPASVSFPE